jgi:hypothetical protein
MGPLDCCTLKNNETWSWKPRVGTPPSLAGSLGRSHFRPRHRSIRSASPQVAVPVSCSTSSPDPRTIAPRSSVDYRFAPTPSGWPSS